MPDNPIEFDAQSLISQRDARAMLKHEARILNPLAALGFVALFGLSFYLARITSIYVPLLLFGLYYAAFRAFSNWRQWVTLQKFRLACPHCGRQLGEKIHYFKSPSSKCQYCGQVAWASLKQLKNL
jgi:hypothetical protein